MMTLFVESTSLQSNAGKMTRLTKNVNSIYDRFARAGRAIDWDVMGEAQLDKRISQLLNELNQISSGLKEAGTALQNIEKEYLDAQKDAEKMVNELPVDVNQFALSYEEIGRIIGNTVGSTIFPWLGPVFGTIGGWYGGLIDDPLIKEGQGQFLGADTYGKVGLSGPGYEIINEGEHSLDEDGLGYERKIGIEGYALKGEAEGQIGLLSGDATVKAIGGSVVGTAQFSLINEKGEFDPGLELGAEGKAYVLNGEANARFGTDDYNIHIGGEGSVCVAEASAGIQINEDGVEFGAEAGAAVLKGEARGGFTIFGITIDAEVEGEVLGVGAGAGFKAEDNSIELFGKLSAILGAGIKLKISW